jgi:hypothetical protein
MFAEIALVGVVSPSTAAKAVPRCIATCTNLFLEGCMIYDFYFFLWLKVYLLVCVMVYFLLVAKGEGVGIGWPGRWGCG